MTEYDISTPVGTDAPSTIDNKIRDLAATVAERIDVDHLGLDGDDIKPVASNGGKHRKISFYAAIVTPTPAVGETIFYTKTVSGVPELHVISNGVAEKQLTSGGNFLFSAADVALLPDGVTLEVSGGKLQIKDGGVSVAKFAGGVVAAGNIANVFGAWETKATETEYIATTDGIVTAWWTSQSGVQVLSDAASPPATARAQIVGAYNDNGGNIVCPIRKGDNWKVHVYQNDAFAGDHVLWLPIGSV